MDTKTLAKIFTDAIARLRAMKHTGEYTFSVFFRQGGIGGYDEDIKKKVRK